MIVSRQHAMAIFSKCETVYIVVYGYGNVEGAAKLIGQGHGCPCRYVGDIVDDSFHRINHGRNADSNSSYVGTHEWFDEIDELCECVLEGSHIVKALLAVVVNNAGVINEAGPDVRSAKIYTDSHACS